MLRPIILTVIAATIQLGQASSLVLCPVVDCFLPNTIRCIPGDGSECGSSGICCGHGVTGAACCVAKPATIPTGMVVQRPDATELIQPGSEGREDELETVTVVGQTTTSNDTQQKATQNQPIQNETSENETGTSRDQGSEENEAALTWPPTSSTPENADTKENVKPQPVETPVFENGSPEDAEYPSNDEPTIPADERLPTASRPRDSESRKGQGAGALSFDNARHTDPDESNGDIEGAKKR